MPLPIFFLTWIDGGGRCGADHTPIAPAMPWSIGRVLALDSGLARWRSLSVGSGLPRAAPDYLFA